MEKIYPDADEKMTRKIVAYATADDGYLFADAQGTLKLDKDQVLNWFLKGLVICMSGEYFIPIAYKEDSGAAMVTVAKDGGSSATLYNFYSSEHGVG